MKKYRNLIIWTAILAVILIASFVFYDKYNQQIIMQPPLIGSHSGENGWQTGNKQDQSDTNDPDKNTADNAGDQTQGNNETTQGNDKTEAGDNDSQNDVPHDNGTGGDNDSGNGDSKGARDNGAIVDNDKIMVPDFTLKDLDGNEVGLSDYEGKIVILNFWAVWCKYCIEEMPDFEELDKELKKAGDAVILAVNVQEPFDTVYDFITKNDIGIKVLLDEDGYVSGGIFGVQGYPTTFIVNKDRSLYTYIPGKTDIDTMRMVIDMARNNEQF